MEVIASLRKCIGCEVEKPASEFYFRRDTGKYANKCKVCQRAQMVARYWQDPERFRAEALAKHQATPVEIRKARHSAWHAAHRDEILEKQRRYRIENREALLAQDREYRKRNPGLDRNRTLRRYGLDVATYDLILAAQDGGCAICGGPPNGKDQQFHIDHDHSTGRVRGLLCHSCNTSLGHFGDSIPRLEAAIAYLRRFA